jgi:hypothetical protein
LRFAVEREHHKGRRSPATKLLIQSPIESLGKLINDLEPASRLKTYCGRAVIQHPTFNEFARAQQFDSNFPTPTRKCVPRRIRYKLEYNQPK